MSISKVEIVQFSQEELTGSFLCGRRGATELERRAMRGGGGGGGGGGGERGDPVGGPGGGECTIAKGSCSYVVILP